MTEENKEQKESEETKKGVLESDPEAEGVVPEDPFKEDKEKTETEQEKELKEDLGEETADIYSEGGREEEEEHDEIEPWEEGFVEGAEGQEEKGVKGNCATCGKPLGDREEGVVERKINGETLFFCSEKCAAEYESKVPPDERGE